MVGRVRVAGHSMEPSLRDGDRLLYARVPYGAGSVVVARDPRDRSRWLVKRVAALDRESVILASDDARHAPLVAERREVIGKVLLRYLPRPGIVSAPSTPRPSPAPNR